VCELADEQRIRRLLEALANASPDEGVCYLTGGATAVLLGWRATTLDVDIALDSLLVERSGRLTFRR
jgi:hypothetical protein